MLLPTEHYHDLATLVRAKAEKNGEKTALRFAERDLSYRALDRESEWVAGGLTRNDVARGDRVACLLLNSPEFATLWFGVAKRGAVLVPLNTALKGEILRYELADSKPAAVVVDLRVWNAYEAVRDDVKIPHEWLYDPAGEYHGLWPGVHPWRDIADPPGAGGPRPEPDRPPAPSDPASILYTSGTTGPPKGAVLPHERCVNTPREIGLRARLEENSVLFTALPLFHCNAQEKTTVCALLNDLTAAIDDRFHASTFWETAARFGATHVSLLTSMINVLYKQPEKPTDRTHSVRMALTSGTARELWRDFERRFGVTVLETYGMTECGCTSLMNPPDAIRVGSVGTPLGFVEAQVVDEAERTVPDGTPGELVVRPRVPFSMFLGYWQHPEATVAVERNLWFHTGDVLVRDRDGYYAFVERQKDIIRRRGENISPSEVEAAFERHPAVAEAVAVGVPSPVGEDDVKAFVRLRPGANATADELFRFVAGRLPFFMVPRFLEFIDEIPKTANEKAQRYLLRQRRGGREYDREALGVVVRPP
jgi:crotonobetaine/carnitine-CoA ligase